MEQNDTDSVYFRQRQTKTDAQTEPRLYKEREEKICLCIKIERCLCRSALLDKFFGRGGVRCASEGRGCTRLLPSSPYLQKSKTRLIFTLQPCTRLSPSIPKTRNFLCHILLLSKQKKMVWFFGSGYIKLYSPVLKLSTVKYSLNFDCMTVKVSHSCKL